MIGTVSESNYPKAVLYKNTGFNSVNVPKNWTVLRSSAESIKEYPIMELTQILFLDSIRIKVNSEFDVAGVDYVELQTTANMPYYHAFYACHKYEMLSPDVAELYITQDSWMTVGGVDGIDGCLDGMATRSNNASNGNVNVVEDPMLIPHYPIVAFVGDGGDFTKGMAFDGTLNDGIFVSNMDLAYIDHNDETAVSQTTGNSVGAIYKFVMNKVQLAGGANPDYEVISKPFIESGSQTVPNNPDNMSTRIIMAQGDYDSFPNNKEFRDYSGRYYIAKNVIGALNPIRSFGLEDSIVQSYQPMMFVGAPDSDSEGYGYSTYYESATGDSGTAVGAQRLEYRIDYTGSAGYQSAVPVPITNSPKYIKTLLGKFNKYVLISPATGNSREVLPEDLDIIDMANPNYRLAGPILYYAADPRPEGRPYFNIRTKDGVNMYQNAVQGEKWANYPIVYRRESGEALKQLQFRNEQLWKDRESTVTYQDVFESDNILGGIGNTVMRGAKLYIANKLNKHIGQSNPTPDLDLALMGDPAYKNKMKRQFESAKEREQYALEHGISVPEVRFGYSGTLREATGNGAMLIKFGLDPRDIALFDKIQEQFGVSCYEPLTKNMITGTSGQPYAYVEAKSSSFKLKSSSSGPNPQNICNKDILEDLASMFSTGIRIWSVKPDVSYYDPYRE